MRLPVLDVLENPDVGLELDRPPQGVDARGPRLGVHLVGETEQRRPHELLGRHLAAGDRPVVVRAGDVAPDELVHDLWQREHRQQRDDVRESLVKRGLVGRGGRHEAAAQSVDEGVRGLVNDDVVRQAHEDRLAGISVVTEYQRLGFARVKRVHLLEGVRDDLQLVSAKRPGDPPAERVLKMRQGTHHQRVDVAGMKRGISEDLRAVTRSCQLTLGNLSRFVHRACRRVVVDDLHAMARRSTDEVLPRNRDRRRQN